MLNIDEINGEIARLERQPLTYVTVERLAWLYIVRDHTVLASEPLVKTNTEKTAPGGDSDFCKACEGKSIESVMDVVDELMDTLHVMQPRVYNAVMQKLY